MGRRIRSLKPELLDDEKTALLPHDTFRLFVSFILIADDYGNLRAHPQWLAGAAFWGHVGTVGANDVGRMLRELEAAGLATLYVVKGQAYAHVTNWEKHQKVDHPGKPVCPGPGEADPPVLGTPAPEPLARVSRESRAALAPDLDLDLDRDQDQDRERGSARARDPVPPAGLAVVHPGQVQAPPPRPERPPYRSAFEWCSAFGLRWADRYNRLSYGDPGDGKAQGKLQELLDGLPDAELAPLWGARAEFFSRYLASDDQMLVKVRHNFAFFVGRWNDFRPDLRRGKGKPAGLRYVCDWHMDADNTGQPAPRPDGTCVECQQVAGVSSRAPPMAATAPMPMRDAAGR